MVDHLATRTKQAACILGGIDLGKVVAIGLAYFTNFFALGFVHL